MNITYRTDKNILYIAIKGRIDASNAAVAEEEIYAIKKGKKKILKKFDSFETWFSYYFNVLYEEYDDEGRKKHPNKRYKDIPALYHEICKFF